MKGHVSEQGACASGGTQLSEVAKRGQRSTTANRSAVMFSARGTTQNQHRIGAEMDVTDAGNIMLKATAAQQGTRNATPARGWDTMLPCAIRSLSTRSVHMHTATVRAIHHSLAQSRR